MSAKLIGKMALLVSLALLLWGTASKAAAVVASVEPPLGADPGAVLIRPIAPFAQPAFTVRPPFAVQPNFMPFTLHLPGVFLAPSLPIGPQLNLDALFADEDFILGVGAGP